jgi:hypothetical protein
MRQSCFFFEALQLPFGIEIEKFLMQIAATRYKRKCNLVEERA